MTVCLCVCVSVCLFVLLTHHRTYRQRAVECIEIKSRCRIVFDLLYMPMPQTMIFIDVWSTSSHTKTPSLSTRAQCWCGSPYQQSSRSPHSHCSHPLHTNATERPLLCVISLCLHMYMAEAPRDPQPEINLPSEFPVHEAPVAITSTRLTYNAI